MKSKWRWLYWFLGVVIVGPILFGLYKLIFGSSGVSDKGAFDFNSIATRELRAKNPLGVSVSQTFEWENVDLTKSVPNAKTGQSTPGVDNKLGDHLVIFKNTQDGLNAAGWLLYDLYFERGINTPASIGNKWAGDKTGDYGNSIAKIMGLDPNATLTYGVDGPNLMKALARMENGTPFVIGIPKEMYQFAIAYGAAA